VSEATQQYRGAIEAVERVLNRGGDADDVLREVVRLVHERVPHLAWVGIAFVEEGELLLGPEAGATPEAGSGTGVPIVFRGSRVAELQVVSGAGDEEERAFLERLATLVSAYCLVGWDTGGVPWSEVS
jgi:putative methionine-R-sulfoxide reductase with GAF domain